MMEPRYSMERRKPIRASTQVIEGAAWLLILTLEILGGGCASSQRQPTGDVAQKSIPEFSEIQGGVNSLSGVGDIDMPLVDIPGSSFKAVSWKNVRLDPRGSFVQCGNQRRGVEHSGDSLAVSGPMTFRMVGTDPISYAKTQGATAPISRSVIWVEPGENPQTIVVTTDPSHIDLSALSALDLRTQTTPKLKLEFYPNFVQNGISVQFLFGEGTEYWGATKGPVRLNGKIYRDLHGARLVGGQLPGGE